MVDRIQVQTDSLTATARRLASDADQVSAMHSPLSSRLEAASAATVVIPLEGVMSALAQAWGDAIARFGTDLKTYAANTELAAILYEENDQSVGKSMTPKAGSPPPQSSPSCQSFLGLTNCHLEA